MKIESIKNKIRNKRVISFDVYGTLVDRVVKSPCQIFDLVEKRAILDGYNIKGFARNRQLAERIARDGSNNDEITIDEIYDKLQYKNSIKDYLKNTEIEIEKDAAICNQAGYKLMQYACELNKDIVVISDMYLPIQVIREILNNCGYRNFEYKLFVSSESGVCKRRKGKLYTRVINRQKYSKRDILHIGDDIKADYVMAKKVGIDAALMNASVKSNELHSKSYMINRVLMHENNTDDYFYNYGYYNYGPLVFGFCTWLDRIILEGNFDELVFIARDGYVLQEAYKIINPEKYRQISKSYFFASRRSAVVSTLLDDPSIENIFKVGAFRATADINDFLERYGISKDEVQDEMSTYHITGNENIDLSSIQNSNDIQGFVVAVLLKKKSFFEEQDRLFREYIDQEIKGRKNLVIDTGYNGTIQHVVQSKKTDRKFIGAYIGVNSESRGKYRDINVIGYLMDGRSDEKTQLSVRTMMGMYDLFFSAPYGSTVGYKKTENGRIEPILDNYEYQDYPDEADKIRRLRRGAIDAVKVLSKSQLIDLIKVDAKTASDVLYRKCISPNEEDLQELGNLLFLNGKMLPLAKPDDFSSYLTHPDKLKNDFGMAMWKVGFMKRLFKAPLPYNKILELLYKINDTKNEKKV